jgi:phage/plasmid-like protein (TIGR03299 family)
MADNIDSSNDRANIAYLGSRKDVWHHHGQEMLAGQATAEWRKQAGLEFSAILAPVFANLNGPDFAHISADKRIVEIGNKRAIVRNDTGAVLGFASDGYQPHQPSEVLDWFDRYISVDDRFQLDVAGSLKGGAIIWATAKFNGEHSVAGEKHTARVLMSTTFDATRATINKMTETRVVCNNTLDTALADGLSCIRTTHRSKFDAARVGKELAALAQGVANYKQIGDALAQTELAKEQVSEFFKTLLDIPFDQIKADTSTRKLNQFAALNQAYRTTVAERGGNFDKDRPDAWTALQAITRYVDHDRSARGDNESEARFASAQFGTGNVMKGQAMQLLLPRIKDKVLIAA